MPPRLLLKLSLELERQDHFVGADQPQIAADEFVGHVGIGLARIEQRRAMTQIGAGRLEPGKLDLTRLKVAMIAAPRKQAIGPGDGVAGKGSNDDQRQCRPHRTAD